MDFVEEQIELVEQAQVPFKQLQPMTSLIPLTLISLVSTSQFPIWQSIADFITIPH